MDFAGMPSYVSEIKRYDSNTTQYTVNLTISKLYFASLMLYFSFTMLVITSSRDTSIETSDYNNQDKRDNFRK